MDPHAPVAALRDALAAAGTPAAAEAALFCDGRVVIDELQSFVALCVGAESKLRFGAESAASADAAATGGSVGRRAGSAALTPSRAVGSGGGARTALVWPSPGPTTPRHGGHGAWGDAAGGGGGTPTPLSGRGANGSADGVSDDGAPPLAPDSVVDDPALVSSAAALRRTLRLSLSSGATPLAPLAAPSSPLAATGSSGRASSGRGSTRDAFASPHRWRLAHAPASLGTVRIVMEDPDDGMHAVTHSVDVCCRRTVASLLQFVERPERYDVYCDGLLVEDPSTTTFFAATKGADGAFFSFHERRA